MERLAAGPRRAGMFAGGNRHCHLAGGALRRPGRGVAAARRVVLGGGRICRRAGRCGAGRRGHRASVARGISLCGFRHGRYAVGRSRGRARSTLLVLSALFAAFDRINADYTLVEARTIDQSRSYKPVLRLSEAVFPFLEWVGDRVPELDEKSEDDGA